MSDAPYKHAESTELDGDAVSRIVGQVGQRGPALVKRGRRIRQAQRAGLVGGAATAVVLLAFVVRPSPEPAPTPMACSTWVPATDLDLGRRGVVVTDGRVTLKAAEPCRTIFELHEGRITILARDLGGGTLAVIAGEDEVVVRGTLFSVEHTDDATIVSTAEGTVEVTARTRVAAGHRARITRKDVARSQLPRDDAAAMRRTIGIEDAAVVAPATIPEPPTEPQPERRTKAKKKRAKAREVSVDDLIRQAHAARKSGDLDGARRSFEAAGSRPGLTAEAAWLGLARLELNDHQPRAALGALSAWSRHFPNGRMAQEAAWLEVRAHADAGEQTKARATARGLMKRWPKSAQAKLARRFLDEE